MQRERELGSVALLVALMWTTLFGMAVLAVDFGYLYTKRRNLQAVTDAAVTAAMPAFQGGSRTIAEQRATGVAGANTFVNNVNGATITYPTGPANQFSMQMTKTYPTFFGGLFGLGTRTLRASTTGQILTSGAPVIHANAGCGMGAGFTIQGSGSLTVTGNIQSNGTLRLGWMAGPVVIPGTVRSPCAGQPDDSFNYVTTDGPGGPFTDPFTGTSIFVGWPACAAGSSLATTVAMAGAIWTPGAGLNGSDRLTPGVYCSSGTLAVSSPFSMAMDIRGSTFLALGQIQFGANDAIYASNFPGVPQNIVAFSMSPGGCGANPAINIGTANRYEMTGALYAPAGCINGGGGSVGWTMNGSTIGNEINLALHPASVWTISGGGGGGSGWRLVQ